VELNERQKKALGYLKRQGKIANRDYRELFGVVRDTAHRDLIDLLDKGLVKKRGVGRGTCYVLMADEKSDEKSDE